MNKKAVILTFIAICCFHCLTNIDYTAINTIALKIGFSLNLPLKSLHWLISSYFFVPVATILMTPLLAERIGLKRTYLLGCLLFLAGSLMFILSNSLSELICSRFIQGVGAAILLPSAISIAYSIFDEKNKTFAISITVMVGALSQALGPIVSSILASIFSWKLVFAINIPIGLAAMLLFFYFFTSNNGNKTFPIEIFKTLVLSVILWLIILIASDLATNKLSWELLGKAAIAFLLCGYIFIHEKNKKYNFAESIKKNKYLHFKWLIIARGLFSYTYFATIFLIPLQLQIMHQFTLIKTGKSLFILLIVFALTAITIGSLSKIVSRNGLLLIGAFSSILSLILLLISVLHFNFTLLYTGLLFAGFAGGSIIPCSVTIILSLAKSEHITKASGIYTAVSIFFAGLGVILTNLTLAHKTMLLHGNHQTSVRALTSAAGFSTAYFSLLSLSVISMIIFAIFIRKND